MIDAVSWIISCESKSDIREQRKQIAHEIQTNQQKQSATISKVLREWLLCASEREREREEKGGRKREGERKKEITKKRAFFCPKK